jgi:3-oxoacyl-[acyl-carrier-protein] synthase II
MITAAGCGVEAAFRALLEGRTAIKKQPPLWWPAALVAEEELIRPAEPSWADVRKYAGRASRMAVLAARQAFAAGERGSAPMSPARTGVVAVVDVDISEGAGLASVLGPESHGRPWARLVYEEMPDFHVLQSIPSGVAQLVALAGPCEGGITAVTGPAAGGLAGLAAASRWIASGALDRVVVAGSGAMVPPEMHVRINDLDPLATHCEDGFGPFDAGREGTWLGEGATALILEAPDSAAARGATVFGWLLGCETCTAPSLAAALDACVTRVLGSGPGPGLVFAHGAASPRLDAIEATVLASRLAAPLAASKGALGNVYSSSALTDIALALRSLTCGLVPPVALCRRADPALPSLDLVRGAPRPLLADSALITGLSEPLQGTAGTALIAVSHLRDATAADGGGPR